MGDNFCMYNENLKNDWKIAEKSLEILYHNAISQNPAGQFSWDSLRMGS